MSKALYSIHQREVELSERRLSVLRDLASSLAARTAAFSATLRNSIAEAVKDWDALENRKKNDIAKALCSAVGSNPKLYRNNGHPNEAVVTWYEVMPNFVGGCSTGRGSTANWSAYRAAFPAVRSIARSLGCDASAKRIKSVQAPHTRRGNP